MLSSSRILIRFARWSHAVSYFGYFAIFLSSAAHCLSQRTQTELVAGYHDNSLEIQEVEFQRKKKKETWKEEKDEDDNEEEEEEEEEEVVVVVVVVVVYWLRFSSSRSSSSSNSNSSKDLVCKNKM